MRGKLLSFLDLLAITVAAMVMILSIVPDEPFDTPPTDWYAFTMEVDPRAVTEGSTDKTPLLGLGFMLNINGERLDLVARGNGERKLTCDPEGLELTCYFRGKKGQNIKGYFFIRDDLYLLNQGTEVTGSVSGLNIGLVESAIKLTTTNRFMYSYEGVLK